MDTLALASIRRDGGTQSRATLNEQAIADYAESMRSGEPFPPLIVFYDGSTYWLADGFHRAEAYEQSGVAEAECEVRQGSRRDAVLFSVGANAKHGLRRTNADKRRAVETLLADDEWRKWSDRKIAKVCGVSHDFTNRMRKELSFNDSPTTEPETRIGADGVERSMPRRAETTDEPQQFPTRSGPIDDVEDVDGYLDDEIDLPPAVDAVIRPEPASERRPVAPHAEPNTETTEPSDQLQSVADSWNAMTADDQDDFLDAVGAVRFSTLEALAEERARDGEYELMRKLSEPNASAGRAARMIAAVLDGGDWALARLGLTWSSTEAEAKRAFRQASLIAHPDRGGSTEEFTAISRANAIVMRWLQGRAA